ncbi:LysR family transcriptional regulator [Kineococcus sp. GCM10028916]|uniref:LysR family transcriptional regulator n=1 Tax=Kineococcus sp. GCM10028916 TaxID=3273394 RepID=UPI00362A1814
MDPRLLRAFATVAEEGHFGRAAARLAVAQPALSRQVQQLERRLGITLLERTARGSTPTAAGWRILPEVQQVLAQHERLLKVAADCAVGEDVVRVAAPMPTPAGGLLTETVRTFRQGSGRVRVEVLDVPDHLQAQALREGAADVALSWNAEATDGLLARALLEEETVALLRADHPLVAAGVISLSQFGAQVLLFPVAERRHCWRQLRAAAEEADVLLDPVPTAPSAVLDLVAGGLGVSAVPASFRLGAGAGLAFVPVHGLRRSRTTLLSRAGEQNPAVLSFISTARDAARTLAATVDGPWAEPAA